MRSTSLFSQPYLFIAVTIATVIAVLVGCNRRSPLPLDPALVTPSSPTLPAAVGLFGISFAPPGLFGGAPGSGTAILSRQASDGGVVVRLSSADPATVTVPSTVTIPEGTDRAVFPIATQTVSTDRQVSVTGSGLGSSASAALQVWAVLPTFFSFFSDPGDPIGRGSFGRLVPPSATFSVSGTDVGGVSIVVGGLGEFWSISFGPPLNGRLQVGRYDVIGLRDGTHASMSLSGRSSSCATSTISGQFELREFIVTQSSPFTPAVVSRFDATFEQHCSNGAAALRGEIRYTAGAR